LLKLDSDKKAKMAKSSEVAFSVCATASATGAYIRERFEEFHDVYPDIFVTEWQGGGAGLYMLPKFERIRT